MTREIDVVSRAPYSLRKHRKLPGQSDLTPEDWAEVSQLDDDHLWAEAAAIDRDKRRQRVNIAENLKALRLKLSLTQTEMAQHLGISLRSFQMYERGERPLTSDILTELYVLYDIDLHQLFTTSPREPTRDWKEAFCSLTLSVADDVAQSFPRLTHEDQRNLTKEYMGLASPGEAIDGGDLLMCHSRLFKPLEVDDNIEP